MSTSLCIAAPATTQATLEELPKPTLVTLKLDHTPAPEALKQLFDQADIPSDWMLNQGFAQQMADVTASGTFEKQPFNQMLLEICRQCWLEPQYSPMPAQPMQLAIRRARQPGARPAPRSTTRPGTQPATTRSAYGGVVVYRTRPRPGMTQAARGTTQPSWVDAPTFASGPLLFVASDARRTSRVDLEGEGGEAPGQTMQLNLMVLRDPKVRVFSISDRLEVDEAKDETGRSLLAPRPPGNESRKRVVTDGRWNPWTINVPLAYTEQSHKLAVLRGRLVTTFITRTEPVEVINAQGAVVGEKTVGDVHFVINKLESAGDSYNLGIKVFRTSDGDQQRWDEVRGITRNDLFRINDSPTGAGYWINSNIHSFMNNSEYQGMIQFHPATRIRNAPKPEKITKVIWNVPVEFQEFAIPVEFKDLTLP